MTQSSSADKPKKGPVIAVIAVVVILVLAFVPVFSKSYAADDVITQVVPTSTIIVSTQVVPTEAVITETQTTTATSAIFNIQSQTIPADNYVYQSESLQAGEDVSVTWNAENTVNVFLFSSSQYAAYSISDTNPASMASQTSSQQGTIGFVTSFSDTYYLVVENPHDGILGLGSQSVGLYTATGTASYPQTVTYYSTSSYNTAILSTSTSYYSTTEKTTITTMTSCVQNVISYASKSDC